MVPSSTIHFLEVLSDCLVYMVAFGYKLIIFNHGPHHWVPTLDLQDSLRGGVEGLHVPRSEVPCECVYHFVVVEFPRELEELGCFMLLLRRGVSDSLVHLSRFRPVLLRDLPRHVANQGVLVDLRGVLKHAFVEALLDDLPDGRLWKGAGVDLLLLILGCHIPLYQRRLHSDLDEAVVGHLVNGVRDYRVENGHVPRPDLVELVPFSMRGGPLDEGRLESCHLEVGVHPAEHAIHVPSHNDFGGGVLPHYVLCQLNHLVSPLHHGLLVARFQVHIEDVDFLASQEDFGPVQVGAQRLDFLVAFQVAERDASSGPLEKGLVAHVSVKVEWGGQLRLIEQHDVRSLFTDQPVQVLLLLHRVDSSHIPHEH